MANEIGGQRLALALVMAEMQELDRAEKLIVDVLLNVADCTEAITKNLGSMDPAVDDSVNAFSAKIVGDIKEVGDILKRNKKVLFPLEDYANVRTKVG